MKDSNVTPFPKEKSEQKRVNNYINSLRDKAKKICFIFVRATPIMETLTGIMIAVLIWYSGLLMVAGELKINNFFSFGKGVTFESFIKFFQF